MSAGHTRHRPAGLRRLGPVALILPARLLIALAALAAILLLVAGLALGQGRVSLTLPELWRALGGGDDMAARVVTQIRLPRVLTGMLTGAGLAMSGAAMQAASRNPLGSPDIIGLTTGAATGALLWIMTAGPSATGLALAAVAGGGLTALAVLGLSAGRGAQGLVLTGFGLGAALAAVNGIILVRGDLDKVMGATLWLAGSLDARGWRDVAIAACGVGLAGPALLTMSRPLALAGMGDDIARSLGVPAQRLRLHATLAAVVLAALATAAAGPIPFVALAAPQIARALAGGTGPAITASALAGAVMVLLADLTAQRLPVATPIGYVTGILGGIYLIGLLISQSLRR